jgi:cell wall-associated NlpC family hydrolase
MMSLRALDRVLNEWIGTPYMAGQRAKGMGVDCVQLIAGVLDDLFKPPTPTPVPRLPADSATHDIRSAYRTIHALADAWYVSPVVRDGTVQPGDVLVTRATNNRTGPRNPGHAMIVGANPFEVVQATPVLGVHKVHLYACRPVIRLYRPNRKDQWV